MDAIIILGAAVWQTGPSMALRRRTAHAAALWHAGAAPKLIACGGMGKHPPTEAEAMMHLLVDAGVDPNAITREDRSTTTFENIRNAMPLLAGPTVTIVTDRYHAKRALMVARHFGLDAQLSSPTLANPTYRQSLREACARVAYAYKLRKMPRQG